MPLESVRGVEANR